MVARPLGQRFNNVYNTVTKEFQIHILSRWLQKRNTVPERYAGTMTGQTDNRYIQLFSRNYPIARDRLKMYPLRALRKFSKGCG